jgi:peptidoglycan/xylan/chitin deacetylase (PgdA/CDA1 family)
MVPIRAQVPIISFTFDDAPNTAFTTGGEILRSQGARATFFVSLGLLGSQTESGVIALREDLVCAAAEGHELGCHTFDHLDTWETSTKKFVESVEENGRALSEIIPGAKFRTFAYPKSEPKPSVKCRLEKFFICCRGGGQTFNAGMTDLNLLKSFFLDRRNKVEMSVVRELIDLNTQSGGWLIFATHDVADKPSRYGCTPEFFTGVVQYAARSGAQLLPVAEACEKLQIHD